MDALTELQFQSRKVMVPPLRTSQKPSTHRRMKPGASSRTPETVSLLHVKTAGVYSNLVSKADPAYWS